MGKSRRTMNPLCSLIVLFLLAFTGSVIAMPSSTAPSGGEKQGAYSKDPLITEINDSISPNSIYSYIYALQNFTTRYAKSPKNAEAAAFVHDTLASNPGLQVSLDPFVCKAMTLNNVIATLPGENTASSRIFIISGHFDSIVQGADPNVSAPGADDDASGAAIMMEAARVLSRYRFQDTIIFAAWDAEELGLYGSEHYAGNASSHGVDIQGVIQFDQASHDTKNAFGLDIDDYYRSNGIRHVMESVNSNYSIGLSLREGPGGDQSDHYSFEQHNYAALMCRERDGSSDYHSTTDTIDKLNMVFAAKCARLGADTLAQLAQVTSGAAPEFSILILPGLAVFMVACVAFRGGKKSS